MSNHTAANAQPVTDNITTRKVQDMTGDELVCSLVNAVQSQDVLAGGDAYTELKARLARLAELEAGQGK